MNILGSCITYPMHRYSQDELTMQVHYTRAIIPHPDFLTGEVSISAVGVQTLRSLRAEGRITESC
jgi:hypothetical protein